MRRLPLFALAMLVASLGSPASSAQDRRTVHVFGSFSYEDKSWNYGGWGGKDPIRPIRRARVQVMDSTGTALARGSTAQDGHFRIPVRVPREGALSIRLRVIADTNAEPGFQALRVATAGGPAYASQHPTTFVIDHSMRELDVGSTVVTKVFEGNDDANPFNMFDMGIHAWEYITGPCGREPVPLAVTIQWPGGNGSWAGGTIANIADDDGYDDAVILHELGHVVHNLYSENDNPGGSHSFGDSDQDPRLSLGEGFATFFGGAVMERQLGRQALYCDMIGSAQTGGWQLRMQLEEATPYANDSYGAADEVAVACVLFDVIDDEDSIDANPGVDDEPFVKGTLIGGQSVDQAWFEVFEGPVEQATNLTLNDFWDGWFSVHGTAGLRDELELVYRTRRVQYFNDADEPNDTRQSAAPIVGFDTWSPFRTLYGSTAPLPVPGKFDEDWYSMDLVIGSRIRVSTRYPNGASDADTQADTEIELYDPAGNLAAFDQSSGVGRNARIDQFVVTQTGTWTFRVRTTSTMRDYGRYNYRVLLQFENELPLVVSAPQASPQRIAHNQRSTLSVEATDTQPLTYSWTPTNGGRIEGSGPSVTFVPPRLGPRKRFRIELTITDSLGAVTGPLPVTVDTRVQGTTTP